MKVYIELKKMPENCLQCPISFYSSGEDGEDLFCPLVETEGNCLERLKDCPIKEGTP